MLYKRNRATLKNVEYEVVEGGKYNQLRVHLNSNGS